MSKQVNRDGYDERTTQIMLNRPITELSRYIVSKWFGTLETLSKQSGVALQTIRKAVNGIRIYPVYERQLREYLDEL